jgi:hypothetical protein
MDDLFKEAEDIEFINSEADFEKINEKLSSNLEGYHGDSIQ